MNICVIPARGGSKRVPRKNIRQFCGKPMIAWSIESAFASGCFDQIIVSTDDIEIATIARQHGADTPFIRPLELADDLTGTVPVIVHAIQWFDKKITPNDKICCLYATAPFVKSSEIHKGCLLLDKTPLDRFVFTATPYLSPIERAFRINTFTGKAYMANPEFFSRRSQDLDESYHDAGQFYWGRSDAWLHTENIFQDSTPLILPAWRVHDIDTEDDWLRAELIHKTLIH